MSSVIVLFRFYHFTPSHYKLRHLLRSQVQREVLVGSFDGERVLVVTDTRALFRKSLVTTADAIAKVLDTPKCITMGRVLTELRPLLAIFLVQTNII